MGDAACMRPRRYLRVHRALVQTSLLWARKRNRFLVWGRCGRSPGRTVTGQDGSPTPADLPDIPARLHRAQHQGQPCGLDARCVCLSPGAKRARGRLSLGQEPCRDTPRVSEEPWWGL